VCGKEILSDDWRGTLENGGEQTEEGEDFFIPSHSLPAYLTRRTFHLLIRDIEFEMNDPISSGGTLFSLSIAPHNGWMEVGEKKVSFYNFVRESFGVLDRCLKWRWMGGSQPF